MTSKDNTQNVIFSDGADGYSEMMPGEQFEPRTTTNGHEVKKEIIKSSDRISVSFADKVSGFSYHMSISRDVPPSQDPYKFLDRESLAAYDKFRDHFKYFSKKNEEFKGSQPNNHSGNKSYGQSQGYNNQNSRGGGDLGLCNKCGAPMAVSRGGKKYCSNKCWLNNSY